MNQLSIFDCFDVGGKPLRIGDKKIRLIETFFGSESGVPCKHDWRKG